MDQTTTELSCMYCGDACGSEICYSCEETANDMGLDLDLL